METIVRQPPLALATIHSWSVAVLGSNEPPFGPMVSYSSAESLDVR